MQKFYAPRRSGSYGEHGDYGHIEVKGGTEVIQDLSIGESADIKSILVVGVLQLLPSFQTFELCTLKDLALGVDWIAESFITF